MLNITHIKADFKQIFREPILVLFIILPLFIFTVFKIIIIYLFPFISDITGFDITLYSQYVLAIAFMMAPQMLGTVAGFLMIDERDGRIYEFMSVTPLGYTGYIFNRLLIPFVFGFTYSFIGYYILNIYSLNILTLIYISIFMGIEGIICSLLLFNLAHDKVQGLTISKAMGIFPLIALTDLLNIKWLSTLSCFFPYYWITKIIEDPIMFPNIFIACIVHILWLIIIIKLDKVD